MRKVTVKWLAGRRIEVIKETPKTARYDAVLPMFHPSETVTWWSNGKQYQCSQIVMVDSGDTFSYAFGGRGVGDRMSDSGASVRSDEYPHTFERFWKVRLAGTLREPQA